MSKDNGKDLAEVEQPKDVKTLLDGLEEKATEYAKTVEPLVTSAKAAYAAAYKDFAEHKAERKDAADAMKVAHETAWSDCVAKVLNGTLKTGSRDLRVLFVAGVRKGAENVFPKFTGEQRKMFNVAEKLVEIGKPDDKGEFPSTPAKYYGKEGARKWYEEYSKSKTAKMREKAIDAIEAHFPPDAHGNENPGLIAVWEELFTKYKAK